MVSALIVGLAVFAFLSWLGWMLQQEGRNKAQREAQAAFEKAVFAYQERMKALEEKLNPFMEVWQCANCGRLSPIEPQCRYCGFPRPPDATFENIRQDDYLDQLDRPLPERYRPPKPPPPVQPPLQSPRSPDDDPDDWWKKPRE